MITHRIQPSANKVERACRIIAAACTLAPIDQQAAQHEIISILESLLHYCEANNISFNKCLALAVIRLEGQS